jgi:signal transduction histidine kinase
MKPWTILRSYLNRSLIRKSLLATSLVWLVLQFPILIGGYFFENVNRENKVLLHQSEDEEIYLNLIESVSRFGNLISARGQVKQLGTKTGLSDVIFCKGTTEIFGKFNEDKCVDNHLYKMHPITFNGENLTVGFRWNKEKNVFENNFFLTLLSVSILALAVILAGALFTYHLIQNRLKLFSIEISKLKPEDELNEVKNDLPEMSAIVESVNEMREKIKNLHKIELNNLSLKFIVDVSNQVAHDIRSPLAALEMISADLTQLPEDTRAVTRNAINRIRDIANSLSFKNDPSSLCENKIENIRHSHLEVVLLSPIIDSIVSEKRLQYRNHIGIEIFFDQNKQSYGLFAKVNVIEIKRAISNIINNSIESFTNYNGRITISLTSLDEHNIIEISDSGKGIPSEILPMLGHRGNSFGKNTGSGLGLSHAKETMHALGGDLLITSEADVGTIIKLIFHTENPPSWFVPEIYLNNEQQIIIFDDDQTVHEIWRSRLDQILGENPNIKLRNFAASDQFRNFFRNNFDDLENAIFCMDFEIKGESGSGLDLIEQLGIERQSILITSHYDEPIIQERCSAKGVRLLPKNLLGWVPVSCGFVPLHIIEHN